MASKFNERILIDALYNLHPNSGSTSDYARAMLVGIVCGMMASGFDWSEAMAICSRLAPKRIVADSVPRGTTYMNAFNVIGGDGLVWERFEGR